MKVKIKKVLECEILVIGAGIAGLVATERALKNRKKVYLVTNKKLCGGASYFPLKGTLGIQVTKDESDYEKYYEDIENMGKGMENPELIKTYISNIKKNIPLLNKIGFEPWLRKDSRPACFAKYSRDIYLINNWKKAQAKWRQKIKRNNNLNILENSSLVKIVSRDNKVIGAIFQNKQNFIFIKSRVIILATGGIASNYKDSLYPEGINGIGHIAALDAGASVQNMEFIQFIPAFLKPKYNVLFGEHTLKYCSGMYNKNGELILTGIESDSTKDLWIERSGYAPFSFDFKSHLIDLKFPTDGAALKFTQELYKDQEEFYTVYLNWLKNEMGIDLLKDEILINHFAHSCNGGIKINIDARTEVDGLYAVGEVASIIEGANRLGGNSVGGSLVFADKAVSHSVKYIKNSKKMKTNITEIENSFNDWIKSICKDDKDDTLDRKNTIKKLKESTSKNLGIVRSEAKVNTLLSDLKFIRENYNIGKNIKNGSLEIYLMEESIKLLALSILARTESRGAHYREDFPTTSDNLFKLKIKRENNEFIIKKI